MNVKSLNLLKRDTSLPESDYSADDKNQNKLSQLNKPLAINRDQSQETPFDSESDAAGDNSIKHGSSARDIGEKTPGQ